MTPEYTLDQLCSMGWTIDLDLGIQRADHYSVALLLVRNGMTAAHISGIARTREEAFADAVARANSWLRHPEVTFPARRRKRAATPG
jgi:hypothetical protein